MERRVFLQRMIGGACLAAVAPCLNIAKVFAANMVEKMMLSDKEWEAKLTKIQYEILRHENTEPPFTSKLLDEHREGVFACAGCDFPLFLSAYKFDSGTGWPSFFNAIADHVETRTDYKIGVARTEYHCARCGGHHGHVFTDGPKPTGLRYCNNGAVLKFISAEG